MFTLRDVAFLPLLICLLRYADDFSITRPRFDADAMPLPLLIIECRH